MGKAASTLGKRAVKPLREFNLEQRVFKEITKEKRKAAPRHESTATLIEESVRSQPEAVKKSMEERDDALLERLRSVYVTSEDIMPKDRVHESPERPLPMDRSFVSDPDYGYFEPQSVPYGRVTLRRAVEAISRHQEDPQLWTAKKISLEYSLHPGLTEKVLRYFRTFVLVVPKDAKVTASALRSTPLTAPHAIKQLEEGETQTSQEKDKS